MRRIQLFWIVIVVFACPVGYAQTGYEVQIAHYEWPQNPSVDAVLNIPQLRSAIARFDGTDAARIIIRYPGGDLGNAWAESLRDSLVSLGIRLSEIVLEPGSGLPETIVLIVADSQDY